MKIKAKLLSLTGGLSESIICFSMKSKDTLSSLEKYKDKEVYIEIKKPSKKRSKDSNSYFWTLCESIAEVVGTSKDEVYLDMLEQYGQFTHLLVIPEAVDRVRSEWRASRVLGERMTDDGMMVELQCFYGSSGYDQKEMCRLIEGTIMTCRDLDIDPNTPDEIALMRARCAV